VLNSTDANGTITTTNTNSATTTTPPDGGHSAVSHTTTTAPTQLPIDVKSVFGDREKGLDALGPNYLYIDEAFVDDENGCDFCIGVAYTPGANEGATLAFKRSEPLDLGEAKTLTFDVRGDTGNETMRIFALGVKTAGNIDATGVGGANLDSGLRNVKFAFSKEIDLDTQWKSYEVNLEGFDRSQITHAFAFEILRGGSGNEGKQIAYLDMIQFSADKAEYPIIQLN
jgi:hypothetical protein